MGEYRIFIDSDVIIDLVAHRAEFAAAAELFSLVERRAVEGFTSPVVLANVEYIIGKYSSKAKARKAISSLLQRITVLPMDHSTAQQAIESKFSDFEDALQYFTAKRGEVDVIVTRNKKDYLQGKITVLTAREFVDLHESAEQPEA